MIERIFKKANFIAGLLPVGALFGLAVFVAKVEIKDFDLWLHIGVGKFIALNHYIPTTDIMSCTITGTPWNNHEWLFQVLVYNIFERFGPGGLSMMQVVLVVTTLMILLFLGYNKDKQLTTAFSLCLVFLIYQQRFTIRPDLFSLLFFTIYIYVLALHIDKRWSILVLFIIQVLWTNMHGFFFFGPLFILIGLFSELIKRHVRLPYEWNESGRLTDEEFGRLGKILVFVMLACLINPQFVKGAIYPIEVLFSLSGKNQIFFEHIQELQRPIEFLSVHNVFSKGANSYYKLLIFLSFLSFVFNRRRIDISALFLWIIFLIFSLKAIRNLPFFAFAAYLVIITNALNISFEKIIPIRFVHKKFEYITLIFVKLLLLLWVFNYMATIAKLGYYDFEKYEKKSEFGGISLRTYPHKAVEFLIENKVRGNFFNDFNTGAYLIGKTFPDIRVFIDGRTEVYGGDFFRYYQKVWDQGNEEAFKDAQERYNLTGALLSSVKQTIPAKLLAHLSKNEEWSLVYFDYDAVIFLKNTEQNKEIIDKFKIDLSEWRAKKVDLIKMGPAQLLPYQHYFRAFSLESMDYDEAAVSELEMALSIVPDYAPAYQLLGKIYGKKGDNEKAFANFRIASVYSPYDKTSRFNLALAYSNLGEYDRAIKDYQLTIQLWPGDAKGYFFLAKNYALKGDHSNVLAAVKNAHQMDPNNSVDIVHIGNIVFDQGEFELAKDIFTIAKQANDQNALIYQKIGLSLQELGKIEQALQNLKKAQSLDPDNEEIIGIIEQLNESLSSEAIH